MDRLRRFLRDMLDPPGKIEGLEATRARSAARQPRASDPRHGRIVVLTVAAWVAAHLLLLAALGLPEYVRCINESRSACGMNLGVIAFLIGLVQLVYGVAIAIVLAIVSVIRRTPPISQGILIGSAVVASLYPVLCVGITGR